MKAYFYLAIILVATGCALSKEPQREMFRSLQKGKIKEDTSYVYTLPYQAGSSHLIVQGYYSSLSHKNRAAIDFKMKQGTKILAARGGKVVRMKEDSKIGGWSRKFRPYGNHIVIEHNDSTRAGYWHLQHNGALVEVGDTVQQGQLIGLSGKTGYSAMPHLHFMVWRQQNGKWQQVATRFLTRKGPKYLRPLRWYRKK